MKRWIFLICSMFFINGIAAEPLNYTITEKDYRFSTYFEMQSKDRYVGTLIKKKYEVRTSYELYDPIGNYEGKGICRALSLGALFAWAKEIDVYDQDGNTLGMIDGQAFTAANAKYSLYDAAGNLLGIAYLDYGSSSFVIVDPSNGKQVLGQLKRNFVQNTLDYWDVVLYDTAAIDVRILKVFSAFAIDFQEYFKEDK